MKEQVEQDEYEAPEVVEVEHLQGLLNVKGSYQSPKK